MANNEKKILLMREGASFLYNALKKRLEENQYELIEIAPDVTELQGHADDADIYMIYLGDYAERAEKLFLLLKSLVMQKGKALCLVGTIEETSIVENWISANAIWKTYKRPVDLDVLSSDLKKLTEKLEDEEERTILLVDDDVVFLKMMSEWLEEKYRVVTVTSGMQAITYLANNTPDLILLDYEMPVTPGPQVLEMIRSEPKNQKIPVMFLTGKNDRESVEKVLELKPVRYLLKSMKRGEVLGALDEYFKKIKFSI